MCGIVVHIKSTFRTLARMGIAAVLVIAAAPARSAAQTTPGSPAVTVSAGYEPHRDRLHYGFENPSTIDTPFLVPHRFDQTYVADNQWFLLSVRYPVFGEFMKTEVSLTPERATFASDLDTFFDPDNDLVVSGTAGDVMMRSWQVAHWSEARLWGQLWRLGYVFRRDVTEFRSTERLLTHSNPASASRTPINTHETTISSVQEIPFGVSKQIAVARGWVLTAGTDVAPVATARLTTILPEKYPGQEIVFEATVATLAARAQVDWVRQRWPLTLVVEYGRTWSYRSSNQFGRDSLKAGVRFGLVR